jgi:glycine betaine/choline ABC-type transport system substrate-binding protein
VKLQPDVGSSEVTHRALASGALDMYPEYIGVLLSEVDKVRERPAGAQAAYDLAKTKEEVRKLTLLEPTRLTNDNALAVTKAYARRHKVDSIDDLARLRPRPTLRAAPEFGARYEGQIGLKRLYGLKLRLKPWMAVGVQYGELDQGKYDVALVFTTDPQLASGRYVVLRDPKAVFAKNHVAPLISQQALKRYGPRAQETMNAVSALLTTPVMRRLNAKLVKAKTPRQVADEFLRANGLKGAASSE